MRDSSTVNWWRLLLGIFAIIVSLLSFNNVTGNLVSVVIFYAIFAICKGIFELFVRRTIEDLTGFRSFLPIIIGVIDIVIGIYLLFNLNIGLTILPYVFAIWFIVDSVLGLFTLDIGLGAGYLWFSLILSILGIVVGISLLFDPLSSALTLSFMVGFYFMLFGIDEIVSAF